MPVTEDLTRLEAYDYDLPPELIAQQPLAERDQARLLVRCDNPAVLPKQGMLGPWRS